MALTITTSADVPNGTYFRTDSAEPDLRGDELTIYSGTGTRRSSWGAPGVTSTVVLATDALVAVHVGFHHKHGGGQFWRYYRPDESGAWAQATWASLPDRDRVRILDAAPRVAPVWAKTPGKVRSAYNPPTVTTRIAYKLVRMADDGRLLSVYDGETEYALGKRLTERAEWRHRGGFYSYATVRDLMATYADGDLWPERCTRKPMRLALLECEISGTILDYEAKLASTYLRPLRIVETLNHTPAREAISA